LVILAIGAFFYFQKQAPKDLSKVSDKEITELLKGNKDSSDYMKSYSNFTIKDKTILTVESIKQGQDGQNFKEVYQGLELQNNRYLMVDLINPKGDKGLVALIDFKTNTTVKAFGIFLFSPGAK